ncbi:MAG TPA: cyclic nucleotide-binding domain-containing protein [Thermoanaerobaculia bacterium]|nr:cyclic nucleotide-binding domain-containing protein [Thermoanaerobaculia bacterium]
MFQTLGAERLASLERGLEEKHLGPNEIVFRQGDPCDGLYIVAQGGVVVRSEISGAPIERIRDLRAGDVFGESGALLEAPRSFAARTVGPTVLWKISQEHVRDLAADPELDDFFGTLVARRRPTRQRAYAAPWTRREPRIWMDRDVVLSLDQTDPVRARLENLSPGGACLAAAPEGWQVRQRVSFRLGTDGHPELLPVRGAVRWREGARVGVAFTGDGPAHRRRVAAAMRELVPARD